MKKYSFGFLLVAVISILTAVLFTNSFEPIDNLMGPPMLSGDYYEIQLAFEKAVGESYVLKYPTKGDYRSSFTFIDLTGDNDEEVIVFYSLSDEIDIVRMNVLDEIDNTWVSIADFESVNSEIQQIEFADLNGDKISEIITGWATFQNDISKKMNIYEIVISNDSSVSINNIYENDYSEFYVYDVDNNGIDDILSLKYKADGPEPEYVAAFLKFGSLGVYEEGMITLDRSISSVRASVSDEYDDFRRIYIDGYKIDNGMATDCFYWNKSEKKFMRITVGESSLTALTSRNSNVFSCDINSDGVVEVPIEEKLSGSSVLSFDSSTSTEQPLIKWSYIKGKKLVSVKYQIINQIGRYSFNFDKKWLGKVTVKNDLVNDVVSFYELKESKGKYVMGAPLFSIKTVDKSPEDDDLLGDYKYLGDNKGRYYYYQIFEAGEEFGINRKSIIDRITFE